jgi:hypothetical protein
MSSELLLPKQSFLPVFSLDWTGLFKKIEHLPGNYGILAPVSVSRNLLFKIRDLGKPFFIDHGIFQKEKIPWYYELESKFIEKRWIRYLKLKDEIQLRHKIKAYLDYCDEFDPDYVFALDILGEPLLSLYLAQLNLEEYLQKERKYQLIGVVQVGHTLYNWSQQLLSPFQKDLPPFYQSPKSFLCPLISRYRELGYDSIALGGLLKQAPERKTGLKFGLSLEQLDDLLTWSRPEFILGGLALGRLDILRKHGVWADSTGWIWWNKRYDYKRFYNRNPLEEVLQF